MILVPDSEDEGEGRRRPENDMRQRERYFAYAFCRTLCPDQYVALLYWFASDAPYRTCTKETNATRLPEVYPVVVAVQRLRHLRTFAGGSFYEAACSMCLQRGLGPFADLVTRVKEWQKGHPNYTDLEPWLMENIPKHIRHDFESIEEVTMFIKEPDNPPEPCPPA